jgi:hypothetical protein
MTDKVLSNARQTRPSHHSITREGKTLPHNQPHNMVCIVQSVDGELVTDLTFINEREGLEWIDRVVSGNAPDSYLWIKLMLANRNHTTMTPTRIHVH